MTTGPALPLAPGINGWGGEASFFHPLCHKTNEILILYDINAITK